MLRRPSTHSPPSLLSSLSILRNVVFFFVFFAASAFIFILEAELPAADPKRIDAGLRERFWQLKIRDRKKVNVVFLGDSRVNQGLSPSVFSTALPGNEWTCRNLAFNAGGLNPLVFDLAESRLDLDSSRRPIIIMGVSPGSLTHQGAENEHLEKLRKRSLIQTTGYIYFPRIAGALSREKLDIEVEHFAGQNEYHDDGWQAALRFDNVWPDAWLEGTRHLFRRDYIRPEVRQELMKRTRRWSEKGILVVGFRPPTSPRLRQIENVDGKFDEEAFAREFISNGGVWISIDPDSFRAYDNSHLSKGEAIKLTKLLAREVSVILSGT